MARVLPLALGPLLFTFQAAATPQNGSAQAGSEVQDSVTNWSEWTRSAEFIRQGLRCGIPDRDLRLANTFEVPSDCSLSNTNPAAQYAPTTMYDLPVVVHVIQNTSGSGFISQSLVQSQIDVLNEDFRAAAGTNGAGGTDAMIQFHLATTDPSGAPTNGITYSTNNTWFNDGGSYWNSLAWDPTRYVNIYTNSAGGALGYVPNLPQGGIVGQNLDRIVVLWSSFGRNGPIGPPFNQGRTTTHEVGHYLGLEHTFTGGCAGGNCYNNGDLICDTNSESSPHFGCNSSASSCGSSDPINNYMDYSDDLCMFEFTPEQVRRMRCTLENWRPGLLNQGGGGADPATALNLDIGGAPTPSQVFAGAASQGGMWNGLGGAAGTSSVFDLAGNPTSTTVSITGGNGAFSFDNAGTSGDVEALLDDLMDAGTSTISIDSMADGTYDVYVYSWAPDDRTGFLTDITIVGGSNGTQTSGGQAFTGSFVEGAHYVRDQVTVAGNSIVVNITEGQGSPTSVNGIQIVPVSPTGGVVTYCTGKTNSLGCIPFLTTTGGASASSTVSFQIRGNDLVPGEAGFLIYGFAKANLNFHGGKLCVKAPIERLLPPKVANSNGPMPCQGRITRNFNNRIQGGSDPLLTVGQTVRIQMRQRDPAEPTGFGDNLTDAIAFTIAP